MLFGFDKGIGTPVVAWAQPAQEIRCFDDGNTDMSGPISERMGMVVIGFCSAHLQMERHFAPFIDALTDDRPI